MTGKGLGEDNGRGEIGAGKAAPCVFNLGIRTLLQRIFPGDFENLIEEDGALQGRFFVGFLQGVQITLEACEGGAFDGGLGSPQQGWPG